MGKDCKQQCESRGKMEFTSSRLHNMRQVKRSCIHRKSKLAYYCLHVGYGYPRCQLFAPLRAEQSIFRSERAACSSKALTHLPKRKNLNCRTTHPSHTPATTASSSTPASSWHLHSKGINYKTKLMPQATNHQTSVGAHTNLQLLLKVSQQCW